VLARHAARRLPAYMLPSVYCHLAQWPLNAHRKVDRQRLPDPVWSAADGTSGVGSGDPWQASLASLWCEVLGVQQVTPDDQFPLLGGSSLGTARLAQRIRDRLGREVDMLALLQHPRLLDMARLVAASPPAPPEDAFAAPRTPVPRQALPAPASEAQARMVFLDRQHPGTALHNIPLTLRLAASPSVAALAAAAEALHHRHEQLRARLRDGQPMLMQESGAPAPGLEHHVAADEPSALAVLGEFQSRPYDIAQGPLWRVALVEKADTPAAAWLALSMHHAISDGVTLARMLEELDALQSGATLAPADTEPGFADYVAWQAEWLASAAGEAARRHWAGGTWQRPLPALPTTTTVTEVGTSVAGRQFVFDFDERITRGLAALALQQRVSPFALMLSLFGLVLGRRCGSQAMVLGVTLGGRSRSAFERAPGLFVNTLPMPFDWHGEERLSSLLQRTTRELSTLQSLQDYPLNRVVALQAGTSPPFNVLFNEEVLPHELRFGGQPAQLEGIGSGVAKLPLVLSFLLTGPAWRIRIEVRDGVCPPEWMAGLLADARRLAAHLEGMADAQLSELLAADGQLLALLEQG
jgi:acyl carrier protein